MDETSFLTFRVGSQWYAMDVQYIFEAANMVAIAPVPDMPDSIVGIVNIRGLIVPVVDLRIRFKVPDAITDLNTPLVFVRHEKTVYGMIVDDIDDVIRLTQDMISSTDLQQRADHIRGLTEHRARLMMILDPVRLLASSLMDRTVEELATQIQSGTS